MKEIRFFFEAALLYAAYGFFSLLPPEAASNVGGFLGKILALFHPFSRRLHDNIARAFPGLPPGERKKIITGMWKNLGRVFAEYLVRKRAQSLPKSHIPSPDNVKDGRIVVENGTLGNSLNRHARKLVFLIKDM